MKLSGSNRAQGLQSLLAFDRKSLKIKLVSSSTTGDSSSHSLFFSCFSGTGGNGWTVTKPQEQTGVAGQATGVARLRRPGSSAGACPTLQGPEQVPPMGPCSCRFDVPSSIYFINVCMLSRFSHVPLFVTPWTAAHQAPLSMDSPGKNTGVDCHAILQGIFLTQGSNLRLLCLLHWRTGFFTTSATWEAYKHVKVKVKSLSRVRLLVTPWTTAHQALCPWGFPGKSTGVGCHCLLR